MATKWFTGAEAADAAERLVPGSVARTSEVACYLEPDKLVQTMEALKGR